MADKLVWRCIICSTEAADKPPRRCPKCGAPSARWRLVANWKPHPAATTTPAAGTTDGAPVKAA